MGWLWESPKWQREGRTGPGPLAPQYAKRSDRNKVRRGKGEQVGKKSGKNKAGWGSSPDMWRNPNTIKGTTKGNGCAVVALAGLGGLAALGFSAVEVVKAFV